MKALFIALLATVVALAQEPEGNTSTQAAATTGELSASVFGKTGMTGSSVGITLDDQGRAYVTNTNRRNNGEIDIRKNKTWLLDSLALTSAEDRQALIKKRMPDTWQDLAKFKEQIIRVTDTNGDGVGDKRAVVYEGFNELGNGLAGGLLWHDGALYVTVMPSLYKLTDKDKDGLFETKQELVRGIGYHIGYGGHDMHGPTLGMDGRIYWSTGDKGISVKLKDGRHLYYPGQGGVFRIEPDGSGFEVFAQGLRNPQELAFDEYGNLFTVDNDGDFGDKERLHYVMEGSDSGWRAHYQYRSDRSWSDTMGYNPWLADNLWNAPEAGKYQPAYLTPSLANFSVGPIGLEYNPGTALSAKWQHTFFLAESSKDIQAFTVEPQGAGFKMLEPQAVVTGPFITGLFFGPDGALYGADWGNNEWVPHMNGGILKLDDKDAIKDSLRSEVQKLIKEGMTKRKPTELAELLGHADQRVRLKAQFELAKRNESATLAKVATEGQPLLARIHAIWGIGQLGRKDSNAMTAIAPLLEDKEPEVRAQTARMMSDANYTDAAEALGKLLADECPRVRSLAGVALAKLGTPAQFDAAVKLAEQNNDADLFLRHAAAMALSGTGKGKLGELAKHSSKTVRLAAVVATRMNRDPQAEAFLADADLTVVGEAARAIHDDLSIPEALPALAKLIDKPGLIDEAIVRRSISANIRVGTTEDAHRLMAYALRKEAPAALRAEALETLVLWPKGLAFDRVMAMHRNLPARDATPVREDFAKAFDTLIVDASTDVQRATAKLVRALDYTPAIEKLTPMALDEKLDPDTRANALQTLAVARAPRVQEAIDKAITSDVPALRVAALKAMTEIKSESAETIAALDVAMKRQIIAEQQPVLALLGTLKSGAAEKLLSAWLSKLINNEAPPEIALDIYEAVKARKSKNLNKKLSAVDASLKKVKYSTWTLALHGGNAEEGKAIFSGSTTAACMQCHTLTAGIPSVGPELSKIATKLTPDRLLKAIVDPQGEIAEGYGLISATLRNGSLVSGLLVKETKEELTLRLPATPITNTVKKTDIVSRTKPATAMPVMTSLLTRMEVRDLVAYLATLK
jgi:quinoprotein glucose dehydrogenase